MNQHVKDVVSCTLIRVAGVRQLLQFVPVPE